MKFERNSERDAYLAARGKVVLNACPGSGKTTTVACKLAEMLKGWHVEYGKHAGVACLSFTNVAKDEISHKYLNLAKGVIGYPHIVSTIDSFVNRFVTLPFYYLYRDDFKARPKIVNDADFMDDWTFPFYLWRQRKDGSKFKRFLHHSYPPSTIDINLDGDFVSKGKKSTLTGDELEIFNRYCRRLKTLQFSKGLLKNSDSTLVAARILSKHPIVAKMLGWRFPCFIVDEAQDTSEIQCAIIDELVRNGLERIELVGDPYQSLYEWREARPDLFVQRFESDEWERLELTQCRRSTQPIVDCYRKLRPEGETNLVSSRSLSSPERVRVIFYTAPKSLLFRYKEISKQYDQARVLVRGGTHLDEFGARVKSERLWKMEPCLPEYLLLSKFDLENGRVRDAIRRVRSALPALLKAGSGIEEQIEFLQEMEKDPSWNAKIMGMLIGLPPLDLTVVDWTARAQVVCEECMNLGSLPNFELKQGKYRPFHKRKISTAYCRAPNVAMVTTIHKAKGMTFDSVMLVLSGNSSGQNISLTDFGKSSSIPREKTRMVYVAMSRPRDQLVVAIPQGANATTEQVREYFGGDVLIEKL